MRFLFLFSVHILFCLAAMSQQNNAKNILDSTIAVMKRNAANRNEVNWKNIEATAYEKAAGVTDPYKLKPAIEYLLQSLNDFHGAFFYGDSSFRYKIVQARANDSILAAWKKGPVIKAEMLKGGYAYVRVPSMVARSMQAFDTLAQKLNDSICKLLVNKPKGFIIDLRLNGGGAMHPMILGLKNLLGEGKMGEFRAGVTETWVLKNNSFLIDTAKLATVTPTCNIKADKLPVVVITGSQTGSSGEFLLMTFKGRPKTIALGSTTAGYVTANDGFKITDSAFLNLSVGYGADRNGKLYREAMKPDIMLEGADNFNDIEGDIKVQAAVKWLRKH
jgi:C-terminal processing protease CtpA/Prc